MSQRKETNVPPPLGLEPQATPFLVKHYTWCSLDFWSNTTLGVYPGGMDMFSFCYLHNAIVITHCIEATVHSIWYLNGEKCIAFLFN